MKNNVVPRMIAACLSVSGLLVLLFPVVMMAFLSFSPSRFPQWPIDSASFRWYDELLTSNEVHECLLNSLFVGICSSMIAVSLGFNIGYFLARRVVNPNSFLTLILLLPAIVPAIIFGFGFLGMTSILGMDRSLLATVIAHSTIFSPIAISYFFNQIRKMNPDIEMAAQELGATNSQIIYRIVAGIFRNNLLGVAVICFVLSWDEYIISWFNTGFGKTYPIYLRNMLESSFSPSGFAIGTIVSIVTFVMVFTGLLLLKIPKNAQIDG
jgi:spermidine/putrescine transport system permease protein